MFLTPPHSCELQQHTNIILEIILTSVVEVRQYYQESKLTGETSQKLSLGTKTGNESENCKARV